MCLASTCLILATLHSPAAISAETSRAELLANQVPLSDVQNIQSSIWSDELNTFRSNLAETKRIVPGTPVSKHFSVLTARFQDGKDEIIISVFLNNCEDNSNLALPNTVAACPMRVAKVHDNQLSLIASEREFWFSSPVNEYHAPAGSAAKNHTTIFFDPKSMTLTSEVIVDGQMYEPPHKIPLKK